MRTIIIAAVTLLAVVSPSLAIESATSTSLSCPAIHALIQKRGAILLRFTGKTGLPNYDKVVADPAQCSGVGGAVQTTYFPAAGNQSCPVLICIAVSDRRP